MAPIKPNNSIKTQAVQSWKILGVPAHASPANQARATEGKLLGANRRLASLFEGSLGTRPQA